MESLFSGMDDPGPARVKRATAALDACRAAPSYRGDKGNRDDIVDQLLALRAFARIAEAGSFAKAADQLNLPRSSVSKMMQDLEAHVGAKLMERTTRAVTITAEGALYYERAQKLLSDLDEMDATVAGHRGALRGRLRVDVGSVLANQILIPALPEFQRRYPEIELMLGVGDRHVDLVEDGVDCVIRGGNLADTALVARRLCALDYVLCAAPAYLEGRARPNHPAEIEPDHQVVSYFSASSGKRFPLRFARDGQSMEMIVTRGVAVNESTAHLRSLCAGLGIGQTFGFLGRPRFASGALVELLADWKPAPHVMHLVYPASRFTNPRLKAFSDWAAQLFSQLDARLPPARPEAG